MLYFGAFTLVLGQISNITAQPGIGLDGRCCKYTKVPMAKLAGNVIRTLNKRSADATSASTTLNYM